ncbi:MAG: response regulator [Gammaproteobacteria bacterium]|jgi:DNA-binding NtrC family response regulator
MAKILIIDDDSITLMKLKAMLEQANHEVVSINDGIHAMNAISENIPEMVITDIIMPEQEGIDTVMQIVENYPDLPVVTMSGDQLGINFLELSKSLGASATLRKPIDKDELHKLLNEFF